MAEASSPDPEEQSGQTRILPNHRLPERFLLSLEDPPDPPVHPAPSATMVLVRQGQEAPEILLLRRNPRSGFIPGAWVFPGGRVDPEDRDRTLLRTLTHGPGEDALLRFGQKGTAIPPEAYWVAAAREVLEETGLLPAYEIDQDLKTAQLDLLSGKSSFRELLTHSGGRLELERIKYIGQWLTPECEPRRYETRFFIARVEENGGVRPHEKELVEYLWLTPGEALSRNRAGALPLVLPTLVTLEELLPFRTVTDAIRILGSRPVRRRLPIPEPAQGGIRFRIPS